MNSLKAKIAPGAEGTSSQLRAASVAFGTSPICSAARFISSRCVHCTCLPLRPAPDHRQGHCLVWPRRASQPDTPGSARWAATKFSVRSEIACP